MMKEQIDGVKLMDEICTYFQSDYSSTSPIVAEEDLLDALTTKLNEYKRDNEYIFTNEALLDHLRTMAGDEADTIGDEHIPNIDSISIPVEYYKRLNTICENNPKVYEGTPDWFMEMYRASQGNIYYYPENMKISLQRLAENFNVPITEKMVDVYVMYIAEHERRHITQEADMFEDLDILENPELVQGDGGEFTIMLNWKHEIDANMSALMYLRKIIQ